MTESSPGVEVTFDGTNTLIVLPYTIPTTIQTRVRVLDPDTGYLYPVTDVDVPTRTLTIASAEGDLSAESLVIGVVPVAALTFPTLFLRSRETGIPDIRGRTLVRYLKLHVADTQAFSVIVEYPGGDTAVYQFSAEEPTDTVFTVPIHAQNTACTVTILAPAATDPLLLDDSDSTPFPFSLVAYEWEGQMYTRLAGMR